ncbi:MAG: cytochrome C assembly protein [Pirellulaceae bacterium]|nr:cytochrome C assembly protein [Pirellulaceae bacterium]
MFSGISLLCFTACYVVSLFLEGTRLLFQAGARFALIFGFAAAGLFAHSIYLIVRAQHEMADGLPLSSWYDWCLVVSWTLAAGYLLFTVYRPRVALGLFVLPLVLGLIVVAWAWRELPPFSQSEATRGWGTIHGVALLLGTVVVALGFVAGSMYLVQASRLKRKLPPRHGLELPSLEWLQAANVHCLVVSSCLLVLGVVSGVILNLVKSVNEISTTPWSGSVVWGSGILLSWQFAAILFNRFYKPARQGKKIAYLTVASFIFVALAVGMALLTRHGSPSGAEVENGSRAYHGYLHAPISTKNGRHV